MSQLVSQTRELSREPLLPDPAFEQLLLTVVYLMLQQCRLLAKSLGADLTPERFLPVCIRLCSSKVNFCENFIFHTFQIPYCIIEEDYQ